MKILIHVTKEILEASKMCKSDYSTNCAIALAAGREYLMSVLPSDLNVEDALEAFGFGRNGLNG